MMGMVRTGIWSTLVLLLGVGGWWLLSGRGEQEPSRLAHAKVAQDGGSTAERTEAQTRRRRSADARRPPEEAESEARPAAARAAGESVRADERAPADESGATLPDEDAQEIVRWDANVTRYDTAKEQFPAEGLDEAWASAAQSTLSRLVVDCELEDLLQDLECRETLCRLEFSQSEESTAKTMMRLGKLIVLTDAKRAIGTEPPITDAGDAEPRGLDRLVMYVHRQSGGV